MYGISIDKTAALSAYKQIYRALRKKITDGYILPDTRLPSTRALSQSLGVSRTVVMEVYDQLKAEGFLSGKYGSGTYVEKNLVIHSSAKHSDTELENVKTNHDGLLSFIVGTPHTDMFPVMHWLKSYRQAMEYAQEEDLKFNPLSSNRVLQTAIQNYLFRMKGIQAEKHQISACAGASQALSVIAQAFAGKTILIEDPCADLIPNIFKKFNCKIETAKVDEYGIIPSEVEGRDFSLLYVSPSHQFPLGGTLPAARRIRLLHQAALNDALIIEDDYDGELRYKHHPIAPLYVLQPERVIYVGTFSKILSPALRLGYMVVPPPLVRRFRKIQTQWDMRIERIQQKAMGLFISSGYLEKHIRKMIRYYSQLSAQIDSLYKKHLHPGWTIQGNLAGLHFILVHTEKQFGKDFLIRTRRAGFNLELVKKYCLNSIMHENKIIIGYDNRTIEEFEKLFIWLKENA